MLNGYPPEYATVLRILVYEQAHHVAANKSGTAGNQYVTFECSHKIKN